MTNNRFASSKYRPLKKPAVPGFYIIAENGKEPHIVEVCVESDSHNMFYALLPNDPYKYPLSMWEGALWLGPLKKTDRHTIITKADRSE